MTLNAWHPTLAPVSGGDGHTVSIDPELLARFDVTGPRYTSYPTADRFIEAYGPEQYRQWLAARGAIGSSGSWGALSVYLHLPFCESLCYYCACNKIITRHPERGPRYLAALKAEVRLVNEVLTGSRRVDQLHFGGGTPTFFTPAQLADLVAFLQKEYEWNPRGDFSIEVDPRTTSPETIAALGHMGLNRISLGVQDFDHAVQVAVNRVQPFEATRAVVDAARQHGFGSINLDLIYGLPKQTPESFARTLNQVLELSPDRIALYAYAHLPERFKPQRRIHAAELPSALDKTRIMREAITRLCQAGYVHIGMDHFAKPNDSLARAQREGRLHRNFQGYSTYADCDLLGFGVSAIGKVGPTYVQNTRDLDEYYDAVEHGRLPVTRGLVLNSDDLIRRAVIMALMCHYAVSKEAIGSAYLIDFDAYFHDELARLDELQEAGVVTVDGDWISISPKGRLLVRAVAMIFDRYLQRHQEERRYSRIL